MSGAVSSSLPAWILLGSSGLAGRGRAGRAAAAPKSTTFLTKLLHKGWFERQHGFAMSKDMLLATVRGAVSVRQKVISSTVPCVLIEREVE